jgi:hypothetical protein
MIQLIGNGCRTKEIVSKVEQNAGLMIFIKKFHCIMMIGGGVVG